MGKLVTKKTEQETTKISVDRKRMASSLDLPHTETFDLTYLQI